MDAQELSKAAERDPNSERLWTLRLGASNINGILYWLARAL
jgi:hypothetical protein